MDLKHPKMLRLPMYRHAWLIALVIVAIVGIPMLMGYRVPVPFILQLCAVAVAASLGGIRSGAIAGLIASSLQLTAFILQVGPAGLIGAPLNIILGVALTVGLGVYLGYVRETLNHAAEQLDVRRSEIQDRFESESGRADRRSAELDLVKNRLLQAQTRLRNVTRRWVDAQESERRSLARELHDDIGQSLTALRISLESNKNLFASDEAAKRFIETSYQLVDEVIASVRELSLNLRPSLLDDLGLVAALREFVTKQMSRAGIASEFDIAGNDRHIDPTHSIAAYRIAQEIVSNITKHSEASVVRVRIDITESGLAVEFEDDGVGFNFDVLEDAEGHFGLASMRERAMLVGGDVDVLSRQGAGTTVTLTMPLRDSAESDAA